MYKTGKFLIASSLGLLMALPVTAEAAKKSKPKKPPETTAPQARQQPVPICGETQLVIAGIKRNYQELGFIEFMSMGTKLQLYANPKTGSWTILAYVPGGKVCVSMAGETFEPMGQEPAPPLPPPGPPL